MLPHVRRKKGFSLIEAAIVLGVVGVVIGSIWVATAHFYEVYKVNKTVEDIFSIAANTQKLVSCSNAETIGTVVDSYTNGTGTITPLLAEAGVFPKDIVNNGFVTNRFGGSIFMRTEVNDPGMHGCLFGIELSQIPKPTCVSLVVKISSFGMMAGTRDSTWTGNRPYLSRIRVNLSSDPPGWLTDSFPVSPGDAETACSTTSNDIIYYYAYTRMN